MSEIIYEIHKADDERKALKKKNPENKRKPFRKRTRVIKKKIWFLFSETTEIAENKRKLENSQDSEKNRKNLENRFD